MEERLYYDDALALELSSRSNQATSSALQKEIRQQTMRNYRLQVGAENALARQRFEIHPRLRFQRRGLLAVAVPVQDHPSNRKLNHNDEEEDLEAEAASAAALQFQFFVTLDAVPDLDGKFVVFGSCSGPTFFNAMRIGQVGVDEVTDRPLDMEHAPRITSVRVLDHPWMMVREGDGTRSSSNRDNKPPLKPTDDALVPWKQHLQQSSSSALQPTENLKSNKRKRKGKLDANVLSFGDEVEEVFDVPPLAAKSAAPPPVSATEHRRHRPTTPNDDDDGTRSTSLTSPALPEQIVVVVRQQIAQRNDDDQRNDQHNTKSHGSASEGDIAWKDETEATSKPRPSSSSTAAATVTTAPAREPEADTKARIDSGGDNGAAKAPTTSSAPTPAPAPAPTTTSFVEARRAKYLTASSTRRNNSNDKKEREERTLARLAAFHSQLRPSKSSSSSSGAAGTMASNDPVQGGLAARMAHRARNADVDTDHRKRSNILSTDIPTYHGQVLEGEEVNGVQTSDGAAHWASVRFQCRQHADLEHQQRSAAGEKLLLGSDGRAADDYEVVDDRSRHRQHHRQHHRHHHQKERHRDHRSHHSSSKANDNGERHSQHPRR